MKKAIKRKKKTLKIKKAKASPYTIVACMNMVSLLGLCTLRQVWDVETRCFL